jgi:DNA-binding ferritin-like protein
MKLSKLLTFQNQLRIFHWQTKSYAEHNAFGSTYDTLDELIDEFVEVFQGIRGRIKAETEFKITLQNYSSNNGCVSVINEFITFLEKDLLSTIPDATDLANIRDEMLAAANKLVYLLTLS